MLKQERDAPKVSRMSVDQRSFGPAHRVRAVGARLEAVIFRSAMDDPGVLPRRQVDDSATRLRNRKSEALRSA